eukprot:Trichotokara_eunicae@DN1699_c0_g1_i1.p1
MEGREVVLMEGIWEGPSLKKWHRGHMPSKMGGRPAWLSERIPTIEELTCEKCGCILTFLVQIYAPYDHLPDFQYHRTIFVFACQECKTSMKVFRSQLPLENPFYPANPSAEMPESLTGTCCECGLPVFGGKEETKKEGTKKEETKSEGNSTSPEVHRRCELARQHQMMQVLFGEEYNRNGMLLEEAEDEFEGDPEENFLRGLCDMSDKQRIQEYNEKKKKKKKKKVLC